MADRQYKRDANGKFAGGGGGAKSGGKGAKPGGGAKSGGGKAKPIFGPDPNPTRMGNLTKRIQLADGIGMERRKLQREMAQKPTAATAERLKILSAVNRTQKKMLPVIRNPKKS